LPVSREKSLPVTTKRMYQTTLNLYILPALGDYKVKDIRKTNLQLLINRMAEKGLTRSIEITKVTLNQIFEMAIDEDIIFKNPTRGLVFPKHVKPKTRSLTEEETKIILTCPLELKERAFISTLYYTGIRRGEIIALSKNDINLEKKELYIKNAVSFEHNQAVLKTPKSIAAIRKIPIPDDLLAILKDYCEQTNSFFLFPSNTGEIMTETVLKRFWKRIIGKINVYAGGNNKVFALSKDISMHIFRHNYTTILRRSGVDAKTAQVLLGHESIKMMLEVYDHISDADVSLATDKINQFSKLTQSKLSQNSKRNFVIRITKALQPLRLKGSAWSWWTDLNPRPADYKSAALPTELHQRNGGSYRARTCDPLLVRQMLSQLS